MKYIDADKLKKEIEKLKIDFINFHPGTDLKLVKSYLGYRSYENVLSIIDSLQQEQHEVNLEEEVDNYFQGLWPGMETPEQCNTDMHFTPPAIMRMARHFYEFGKKKTVNKKQ